MNGQIRWREIEYGALRRRRRQLCCQAVGKRGRPVSAGKTGIAQREIARMNGKSRPGEPTGGLAQSEARPQSFGNDGCRSLGAGIEARDGMLGAGEGGEQRMRIIGRRSRLPAKRRAGRCSSSSVSTTGRNRKSSSSSLALGMGWTKSHK